MRSANRSRGNPPPTRSGTACSGKKSNSPSSPDAINRPMTRIRHGDSRHRNRNAQYLVGPSSKDFQALRGMRIAPSYQRQGIGTRMLWAVSKFMHPPECFCLPHAWLEGFYGTVGFARIEDDDAPPHLQKRLAE